MKMVNYFRILLVAVALVLVFCVFDLQTNAYAAEIVSGSCGEEVTWTLDEEGTLVISGTGPMYEHYYGESGWDGNSDMVQKVIIQDGVTSISANAFQFCRGLTEVIIPASVTRIGDWAFSECYNLRDVYISDLSAWCNIEIKSDYTNPLTRAENLYVDGQLVTELRIPDTVTHISDYTFYGLRSLTSVTIPEGVVSIGDWAFRYCDRITSVTISDTVTSIGDGAFYGCSSLLAVDMGASVERIERMAFSGCRSLRSITLPEGIVSLGNEAFANCSSLNSVDIPASLVNINAWCFNECSSLTGIWVAPEHPLFSSDSNGVWYNKDKTELIKSPAELQGTYQIPESVTSLVYGAFAGCKQLAEVSIPETVTTIPKETFFNCGIEAVTIPDSVTAIENSAFHYSGLQSVVIPDSVTSIGDYAFARTALKTVTIGSGTKRIGQEAFSYCGNLCSVTILSSQLTCSSDAFYSFMQDNMHISYAGSQEQWVLSGLDAAFRNGTPLLHYDVPRELSPAYIRNCENQGLFCGVCYQFITKEKIVSDPHTYSDALDTLCDDCGYIRKLTGIAVHTAPYKLEYEQGSGVMDLTGGLLQLFYTDKTQEIAPMSLAQVTGFDNSTIGKQTVQLVLCEYSTELVVEILRPDPDALTVVSLPKKLYYVVAEQFDSTGLVVNAQYGNDTQQLSLSQLKFTQPDMNSVGVKTVVARMGGASVQFAVYVHNARKEILPNDGYPESLHNYQPQTDDTQSFRYPGAAALYVTFDALTYTETNYDFIYIYDSSDHLIGSYTGNKLAGETVKISGDNFRIQLVSDGAVHKYGYRIASIQADMVEHTYKMGSCSICGHKDDAQPYMALTEDTCVTLSLTDDLYVDLNGYVLSGTIQTNGFAVYGIDSATNDYSDKKLGYFNCVDENGNPVVPQLHVKTTAEMTGSIRRYLTVKLDKGYTFHRFYLGVTHISLQPNPQNIAFGYKAVFYGSQTVKDQLMTDAAFGYALQLEGRHRVSYYQPLENVVSGKTVTLRLYGYDAEKYGQINLNAWACLQLADGTVIESSTNTVTLRQMLENINGNVSSYSATQLEAVREMIDTHPVMKQWNIWNIYYYDGTVDAIIPENPDGDPLS